jgi:hypothetical protein
MDELRVSISWSMRESADVDGLTGIQQVSLWPWKRQSFVQFGPIAPFNPHVPDVIESFSDSPRPESGTKSELPSSRDRVFFEVESENPVPSVEPVGSTIKPVLTFEHSVPLISTVQPDKVCFESPTLQSARVFSADRNL